MTAGSSAAATANMVFTIFSPSPIHLLVRLEDEMLKKVAQHLLRGGQDLNYARVSEEQFL